MQNFAVVSLGMMGGAIARTLVAGGAGVQTSLAGRSAETVARAHKMNVGVAEDAALVTAADVVLSIVPPRDADVIADRFLPLIAAAERPPLFIDCNAISPERAARLHDRFAALGLPFADGAIIGQPAETARLRPRMYLSGDAAGVAPQIASFGVDCRALDGKLGAASELKMAYSALTKGFQALASLVAMVPGSPARLLEELSLSQPELLEWLRERLPLMYAKAYRWDRELEEVGDFFATRGGDRRMFDSAASLYSDLANDDGAGAVLIDRLLGRK